MTRSNEVSTRSSKAFAWCPAMSSPISAIAATAKPSTSWARTPTESTKSRAPWSRRRIAAAIGERIAFQLQQNSTLDGGRAGLSLGRVTGLNSNMQDAQQCEETAGRVGVEQDLFGEPLAQQLRALVVQAAPPHVDRLDLRRAGALDRVVVALADQEVVLDDAAKGRERQQHPLQRCVLQRPDVERETVVLEAEMEVERPLETGDRRKAVLVQQIGDRGRALMLDLGAAPHDRFLVEGDLGDALALRH